MDLGKFRSWDFVSKAVYLGSSLRIPRHLEHHPWAPWMRTLARDCLPPLPRRRCFYGRALLCYVKSRLSEAAHVVVEQPEAVGGLSRN
jgi:hypothetical protein